MFAKRDIAGKIEHSGGNLIRPGAPCASEFGSLALNVLAQRFHLGEKAAEVFEVASGFSSHSAASHQRIVDGRHPIPRQAVFDVRM